MSKASIRYTVGDAIVQKETAITITISTDVPFEYDVNGGCFVKFTFPKEIIVRADKLLAFTGEGYFVTENGNSIIPVDRDLESENKWLIFEACTYNEDSSLTQNLLSLKFQDMILPFAKRSTSSIDTEIYKKWTKADGLSDGITKSVDSIMDISLFETNDVENIDMTASNY
jgi:hypothetical protein